MRGLRVTLCKTLRPPPRTHVVSAKFVFIVIVLLFTESPLRTEHHPVAELTRKLAVNTGPPGTRHVALEPTV